MPFGDAAALDGALDGAAAFIVEPVQGEGGVNVPPPGYLAAARARCDAAGALLIVDEVQTGLGRCGKLFACEFDGVVPDVMTLAKGLSGGVVPIGAYIARPAVWNAAYAKAPLMHTSTFGGSPLACAAALAALDVLRDDGLVRNARERGAQLLAGARRVAAAYPAVVADVRGAGLLVGVELRSEGYGGTIIPEMLKRGVTAAWTLNLQRVIRLEPPLIVTEAEVGPRARRAAKKPSPPPTIGSARSARQRPDAVRRVHDRRRAPAAHRLRTRQGAGTVSRLHAGRRVGHDRRARR